MSESMAVVNRPTGAGRGDWWKAPLMSSLVNGALLLPVTFMRGIAEMGTDECNGAHDCPDTYAQLHFADYMLRAVMVLIVLQWPAAYLLPKARVAISLVPAAAMATVVLAILSVKPGA